MLLVRWHRHCAMVDSRALVIEEADFFDHDERQRCEPFPRSQSGTVSRELGKWMTLKMMGLC